MSRASAERVIGESGANEKRDLRVQHENLALLYQPFLIVIVRLQSRREKIGDAVAFRRKMKSTLQDIEKSAITLNYDFQDVKDAHLAVVAFLDEVVLGADDRAREEWVRLPLAQELFVQTAAGEVFFERLEGLTRSGN